MQASFHGCADFIDLIFRTAAASVSACIGKMRALSAIPKLCSARPAERCGIIPVHCVARTANFSKKLFHSRHGKVGQSYSTIRSRCIMNHAQSIIALAGARLRAKVRRGTPGKRPDYWISFGDETPEDHSPPSSNKLLI